jgi:hypothetical protein
MYAHFDEEFIYRQPLLDRNADFKFREADNLAVFTTRQWIEVYITEKVVTPFRGKVASALAAHE